MLESALTVIHDHKDELLVVTSLAAVSVSLIATVFGPLTQMRIARLNARATILVSGRVKLIESIQSNIASLAALIERAEFLAKSMTAIQKSHPQMSEKQSAEFARMLKEQEEKTFERNRVSALLGLSLDVAPETRHALFRAIEDYAKAVPGVSTASNDHVVALEKVQKVTREILKEEWSWVQQQVSGKKLVS